MSLVALRYTSKMTKNVTLIAEMKKISIAILVADTVDNWYFKGTHR
jgi:hypothetical protein